MRFKKLPISLEIASEADAIVFVDALRIVRREAQAALASDNLDPDARRKANSRVAATGRLLDRLRPPRGPRLGRAWCFADTGDRREQFQPQPPGDLAGEKE